MFSHPMTEAMFPCDKFLIGVKCKEECRFSHGQSVNKNQILPYEEPNFNIDIGTKCLVKNERTDMWILSEIEFIDVENMTTQSKIAQFDQNQNNDLAHQSSIIVKNLSNSQLTSTNIYNIRSLGPDDLKINTTTTSINYCSMPYLNSAKVDHIPMNINKIDQNNSENNKSEIGLKLLMKMGFTPGQELGKYEQGIKEPVKAQNKDVLIAKNTKKKVQKGASSSTNSKSSKILEPLPQIPMFDFLNSKCLNYTDSEKGDAPKRGSFTANSLHFNQNNTNKNLISKSLTQKRHLAHSGDFDPPESVKTSSFLRQHTESSKRKYAKETITHGSNQASKKENFEAKKNKYIF